MPAAKASASASVTVQMPVLASAVTVGVAPKALPSMNTCTVAPFSALPEMVGVVSLLASLMALTVGAAGALVSSVKTTTEVGGP